VGVQGVNIPGYQPHEQNFIYEPVKGNFRPITPENLNVRMSLTFPENLLSARWL